jgi:D-glycero-alpha-D-manno-heptose 1-phosphate guanylyltransferase
VQAIILAGGFGTRLKAHLGDVPKPMAPVAGRPFLCWLLDYMEGQGVTEAVLCVHHLHEQIRSRFGGRSGQITLKYNIEETPLGTGGALRRALTQMNPAQPIFALNGDSLVMLDYRGMMQQHKQSNRPMSIAVTQAADCSRYGDLSVQNNRVMQFGAKGKSGAGSINTGLYILSPNVFDGQNLPEAFSLESDFLTPHAPQLQPAAYCDVRFFMDIGIPDDYALAQRLVPELAGKAA